MAGNPAASFFGFAAPVFALGTAHAFLALDAWRSIREPRLRLVVAALMFAALMGAALPFMVWGFLLEGLTGPLGIAVGTSAPFAAALLFGWVVLDQRPRLWTCCGVMAAA